MEVSTSSNNDTLTIVENNTNISYTDVMILGASVVSPMITSTSQDIKSKVDSAGYKDVDLIDKIEYGYKSTDERLGRLVSEALSKQEKQ